MKAPSAACWPLLNIEQAAGANRSFDRGPTSTASYPWYEISIFATPLGQGDCVERIVFKGNDEIWQKNGVKSWRDIPIAHVDQTISNIEIAITALANGEIAETVAAMNRSGQGGTEARVRWVAAYPANNEKPYILRLSFDSSVACVPLNLVTKHMAIRRDPDSRGTWYGNGILVKEALNEPGCIDELARTISKI